MPQFQRICSPLPSWSVLDQGRSPESTRSSSSRSVMDKLQSPSPSKKRRSAAVNSPPTQRKRTKLTGDLAASLSQSPSKSSFNNSTVISSSRTARIQSVKNAKAGPSTTTKPNTASQSRDVTTPTRVSSRVSRPTFKKKATFFEKKLCSPDSDGTPPVSIMVPSASSPSLKRKKPTNSPMKRLAGNSTPSKSKWLDPNPIELTSDDDGGRAQPPQKRVKHAHKEPLTEVIDLCSESEGVTSSPRRTRTRVEKSVVVVLSTDEEVDLESPSNHLALRKTDTRKSSSLSPLRDSSPLVEDESEVQTLPSPQAHYVPIPESKVPVAEDGITNENNIQVEKADFPRGYFQSLYNEALTRCARETLHAKDIADPPSPFSLKCIPPARTIRYVAENQSPTLHTPLFFGRIMLRLGARLKQSKTVVFSDPNALSDAKAFSDNRSVSSMETSKLNEEQEDLQRHSDIMELSPVNSGALEVITKTPSIDFHDDTFSDTQAAGISPSIPVNNLDANERPVSKAPGPSLPLANRKTPGLIMLEDTPVPDNIQAQEVSTNCSTATLDRTNSSAILPNLLCNTPSNPPISDVVHYQTKTSQEAEVSLFRRAVSVDQVAKIEFSALKDAQLLVQVLWQRYEASKISGVSLLSALELNDVMKPSATESLSKLTECATITSTSSVPISNNKDAPSTSKCLFESIPPAHTMMGHISTDVSSNSVSAEMPTVAEQAMMLNLSSSSGPNSEGTSSGSEYLSESPAIPKLSTLASPSSVDSCSFSSACSHQSPDSNASIESIECHLVTPDDSPSPLTPFVKARKQELLIYSDPLPPPTVASFFDMDISELNLQVLMNNSKFDDDDDISVSGMELVYPEEII